MSEKLQKELLNNFEDFFNVIKRLRGEGGCPWDIAQTPETMCRPLLEEAYEAVDAIKENEISSDENKILHIREELGDVLLNTIMISYMYEQANLFSVSDVVKDVTEKLIRRHPHVFGQTQGYAGPDSNEKTVTADSVLKQWDNIKENVEKQKNGSVFENMPKNFPPILRALKLLKRVSKCGFDWKDFNDVTKKIDEERAELYEAVLLKEPKHIEDEFGDLLFILINASRFINVDPELALIHANQKFEKRFSFVETEMKKHGIKLCKENEKQMEAFWQKAKESGL